MTTQEQNVPKYFSDFVQENARQHQELTAYIGTVHTELGGRISHVEGELKIIKAVAIAMLGVLVAIAVKYFFGL